MWFAWEQRMITLASSLHPWLARSALLHWCTFLVKWVVVFMIQASGVVEPPPLYRPSSLMTKIALFSLRIIVAKCLTRFLDLLQILLTCGLRFLFLWKWPLVRSTGSGIQKICILLQKLTILDQPVWELLLSIPFNFQSTELRHLQD